MDLTWLGMSIIGLFYILCICGICISIKKRRYISLIWGFLAIILGLSLYLFGGNLILTGTQQYGLSPFPLIGGLLILISLAFISIGLILLVIIYYTKRPSNK